MMHLRVIIVVFMCCLAASCGKAVNVGLSFDSKTREEIRDETYKIVRLLDAKSKKATISMPVSTADAEDDILVNFETKLDYEISFPLGLYILDPNNVNAVDALTEVNQLIYAFLDELEKHEIIAFVKLKGTFYGQADGLPVRSLRYNGEFGRFLHEENVELNSIRDGSTSPRKITDIDINIREGSRINNKELAFLRAYYGFDVFTKIKGGLSRNHFSAINFEIVTTPMPLQGERYRIARVHIVVDPDNTRKERDKI